MMKALNNNTLVIEVLGIHEHNKGAMLMLEAIRERMLQTFPYSKLAVNVYMSRDKRTALDVYGVLATTGGGLRTRLLRAMPTSLRSRLGNITTDRVDVVLDAAGFGYGDYWGERNLRYRLVDRLKRWDRPHRVAIMLPQALGPFETGAMSALFREAVALLDLIFVRDATSLEAVRKVSDSDRIRLAPDFTNLLHPRFPAGHENLIGQSFIIPNEKMVDASDPAAFENYISFLRTATEAVLASGRRASILVHEGAKDLRIAQALNQTLADPLAVVDLDSALDTKAVIAQADLVIGSRFHAIVSALSAGVPALACGWSHKYAELMRDYDSEEFVVSLSQPETWRQKLQEFLSSASDPGYRARLTASAAVQRALSEAMWDEAIARIRQRTSLAAEPAIT